MQARRSSALETFIGTAVAFCISVCVWEFIVKPVWGINTKFVENLAITSFFTVVSLVRSYCWRRFWNWLDHTGGWTRFVNWLNKNNKKAANDEVTRDHRPSTCRQGHIRC